MGVNRTNENVSEYWPEIVQDNGDGQLSKLDGTDIKIDKTGLTLPFEDVAGSIAPEAEGLNTDQWGKSKLPSDTVYSGEDTTFGGNIDFVNSIDVGTETLTASLKMITMTW